MFIVFFNHETKAKLVKISVLGWLNGSLDLNAFSSLFFSVVFAFTGEERTAAVDMRAVGKTCTSMKVPQQC